jgi:hypothetical protein
MSITDGQIYLLQAGDSKSVMFEEHYSGHFWRPAYVFIYSVWFMCLLYEVMLHGYAYDSNLLAAKRSTLFVETEAILSDTGEQLDFKW